MVAVCYLFCDACEVQCWIAKQPGWNPHISFGRRDDPACVLGVFPLLHRTQKSPARGPGFLYLLFYYSNFGKFTCNAGELIFRCGVLDGEANVAVGVGKTADGLGFIDSGLEHDQGDGDAAPGRLDDFDGAVAADAAGSDENADAALDQLGVLHVDVDHEVFIDVAHAGHGAGGDHVGDHLLRGGGLHAGGAGDALGADFGDDGDVRDGRQGGAVVAGDAGGLGSAGARVADSGDDVGGASAGGETDDDVFAAGTAAGDVALAELFGVLIDLDGRGKGLGAAGHDVLDGLRRGGEVGWALAGVEGGDASAGAGTDVDEASTVADAVGHPVDDLSYLGQRLFYRSGDF